MTLEKQINQQINKNAREHAQADTARALRAGRLKAGTPAELTETQAFEEDKYEGYEASARARYRETGRLPAGISQGVQRLPALPSINDLAGRTQAPMISRGGRIYDTPEEEERALVQGRSLWAKLFGSFRPKFKGPDA